MGFVLPGRGAADEFSLTMEDNGLVIEVFPNLSMDDAKGNYVETAVNHPDRGSLTPGLQG